MRREVRIEKARGEIGGGLREGGKEGKGKGGVRGGHFIYRYTLYIKR